MFKKKEKKEKSKKHKKQKQQKSVNKPTEKSSNTNPFMSLWNKRPTVFVPKTNQQVFTMLFKDYKENIMRIGGKLNEFKKPTQHKTWVGFFYRGKYKGFCRVTRR